MRVLLANQNRGNILNKWKPLPYSEGVYCVPALRFLLHLPCWLWKVSEMTFSSFRSFVAIRTWTSHFFAELKIYHLSLFITHMPISIWSQQYAGCMLYMNLVNDPARYKSLVAQWLEHPTGVRKVIGSIPVGDSDFSFVPYSWHVDHIISQTFTTFHASQRFWYGERLTSENFGQKLSKHVDTLDSNFVLD